MKNFFADLFNIGYKGKAPIRYWRKIFEVIIQILLLPISVYIQIWCIPYGIFYGHYVGGFITRELLFCGLKKEERGKGFSYNVGASDRIENETVTNKIRDNDGNIVGTYDTTISNVVHDDGERWAFSNQFEEARAISFAALPLRILSIILSVLALFIPHLYISVAKPKTECKYNYKAFRYFDILILEK